MAKTVYRVGQVNAYIKSIFENDYALRQIAVRGEVSNCKYHSSGHIYFTLKDETGVLSAVMFAGSRRTGLKFHMQEGMQVIASGSIMVYERDGRYQLYAREIVQDGTGDLYRRFEETKKRLEEMGMFSEEYKQPIPRYVSRVGIVTAPTGAAIQDIINISHRRNPYVQLVLYPAIVQGEYAPASIVKGIETLDALGLDCIIVGRGGGSIEDLWAFNEEIVAKAIFDADTPIISAVGHETDTTIADYVADLRAPTPSAAAELAVYDVEAYLSALSGCEGRLRRRMQSELQQVRYRLEASARKLELYSPGYKINQRRQSLINAEQQLRARMAAVMQDRKHALALASAALEARSPLARLSAGYGYVSGPDGKAVKSIGAVQPGDRLDIYVTDGRIGAVASDMTPADRSETEG